MLPGGFDIQTMTVIMWIIIGVCILAGAKIIVSLDKPGLRLLTVGLLVVLCLSCYQYTKVLGECEKTGKTCTFFSLEVPQDGGFVN